MWKPYEIGRDFSRKRLEPGLSDLPNHQNPSMKSKLIHAPQSLLSGNEWMNCCKP
jgi:hypothetical protein